MDTDISKFYTWNNFLPSIAQYINLIYLHVYIDIKAYWCVDQHTEQIHKMIKNFIKWGWYDLIPSIVYY